jgi:TPR repeat protein
MDVISWLMRVGLTALVLASSGLQAVPADAADAAAVLESMEATKPDWLPSLDTCPADVMPARETKNELYEGRCASTLEQCLRSCRSGNANDCYASALVLQKVKAGSSVSEALFLRACALGIASGCTNRAAAMVMTAGGANPCAIRTFAAACDHSDPWACTMTGMHLLRGLGMAKDPKRAREVLSKACRFGEADEACRTAKGLMREIRD